MTELWHDIEIQWLMDDFKCWSIRWPLTRQNVTRWVGLELWGWFMSSCMWSYVGRGGLKTRPRVPFGKTADADDGRYESWTSDVAKWEKTSRRNDSVTYLSVTKTRQLREAHSASCIVSRISRQVTYFKWSNLFKTGVVRMTFTEDTSKDIYTTSTQSS